MKSYFLVLGQQRRALLTAAGVPISDMEIYDRRTDSNVDGIIIEEEFMGKALEVLHASITLEKEQSYEGVFRAWLLFQVPGKRKYQQPLPAFKAEASEYRWNGYNRGHFVDITQELLVPVVKRDCILSVPHGNSRAVKKDENFYIYLYSSPENSGAGTSYPPRTMWGISNPSEEISFLPSNTGKQFITDEGWCIAELIDNNLFIHHDLPHYGDDRELRIYRRLLEEVVSELTLTPEQKTIRDREQAQKELAQTKVAYVAECSKRHSRNITETERSIERGNAEIADYQVGLTRKIREVKGAELKLEQLKAINSPLTDGYEAEFDKLLQNPKIIRITIGSGAINVFTETLYCVNPNTKITHEIGRFRIQINTDSKDGGVRWFNLTRQVHNYAAPHVESGGTACLGNATEIFPQLIANYEFAAVVMVAIQFVESVNMDDIAGRKIIDWPVVAQQSVAATV